MPSQAIGAPVRTLVGMHVASNTGFAIGPLERLFYATALELAGGMPEAVHFYYRGLSRGFPTTLPESTAVLDFDHSNQSPRNVARLADYVRDHRIDVVLFFDIQVVGPLFRSLRRAGARSLIAYWGAEISSRMPPWRLALKRAEVAFSRSRLDSLIFESRAMADLALFGRGVPAHMLDIVPLGVDVNLFSPVRLGYAHRALGVDSGRQLIAYAGHMEARKGVLTLLQAARVLYERGRRDFHVCLFGNRPGEGERLMQQLGDHPVASHILFGGYRNDVHQIFPDATIGVIPSSGWDSFPRTAIELAASALPLVVSRLGGLPETIVEGTTGFIFEPKDEVGLANHLDTLLDNPGLARTMGLAGRSRVEREFSLEVQQRNLLRVMRRRVS